MPRLLLWQALILFLIFSCNRQPDEPLQLNASFLKPQSGWVDSMLLEMSVDEKIGQLLLYKPGIHDHNVEDSLLYYAKNNYLGGVMLNGFDLFSYMDWVNTLQQTSRLPLFNATTELVSMNNQFAGVTAFPKPVTIGANPSDELLAELSSRLLSQYKQLGINLSFSPRLNAYDPSKGEFDFQSFVNEPSILFDHSNKTLENLKSERIISIAGNFNSYYNIENDTACVVDDLLLCYNDLIKNGLSGIYVDPAIFGIDTLHLLHRRFLHWYLKRNIDFDGLMIAEWSKTTPFEKLLHAGVDIFVVRDSVQFRHNHIKKFVDAGLLSKLELNNKVRKILLAKEWIGLDTSRYLIDEQAALAAVDNANDEFLVRNLYESALTLLQNPKNLLPFTETYKRDFRVVNIGKSSLNTFNEYFSKYAKFLGSAYKPDQQGALKPLNIDKYGHSKLVIVLDNINLLAKRDSGFIQSINQLASSAEVALVNFGNPVNFRHFGDKIAMVQSYEKNEITESLAAQLLFGALQAKGRLPLAVSDRLPYGRSISNTPVIRFKYTIPEEVGIAAYKLVGIDAIARSAIGTGATPGCQIMVAKAGKIIYSKSFGTHAYDDINQPVANDDLYDLASITKIASTTLATMKLYEQEKIRLDGTIGDYLDCGEKSRIRDITLNQLMTHESGLQANMPIAPYIMYKDTSATLCNKYFCQEPYLTYNLQIADSFYMDYRWRDTIWQRVFQMTPYNNKRFRYSDVNFNLVQKIVESQANLSIDEYLKLNFYYPLNLEKLTYKPLEHFNAEKIVPTAYDKTWRKQLLRGFVHDESAALLGGIGGSAGLFGNAEDLAILFQMLLNGGNYGGKQYLKPETIKKFIAQQAGTSRGLGFDVNTTAGTRSCSAKASPVTFGHTGFTGTCVWVDPENELIYIFLSNRIHPNVNNQTLFREGTRTRIQSLVYDALDTYPEDKKQDKAPEIIRADLGQ